MEGCAWQVGDGLPPRLYGRASWGWLYLRHRSIWSGYVSHAIVDVAVFVIGYGLIFGRG